MIRLYSVFTLKKSLNGQGKSMVKVLQKTFLVQWRNFQDFASTVFSWVNQEICMRSLGSSIASISAGFEMWVHPRNQWQEKEKSSVAQCSTGWFKKILRLFKLMSNCWTVYNSVHNSFQYFQPRAKITLLLSPQPPDFFSKIPNMYNNMNVMLNDNKMLHNKVLSHVSPEKVLRQSLTVFYP